MKSQSKYDYWCMLCDYDIETIKVLIEGKRWVYVAFLCQQAVERQLKGIYVYHIGKEAPKSHSLPFIFSKIMYSEKFMENINKDFFRTTKDKHEDIMVELMFYYMSDYPFSYKRFSERFIDSKLAQTLYKQTIETIEWLRNFQPKPNTVEIIQSQ